MNIKFPRELKIEKKSLYEDFKEGFSIFNSNQSLKTLLMSAVAVINLLGAACMLSLQVIVVREMDLSTRWYSIVFVASPIGVLIGAFITKRFVHIKRLRLLLYLLLLWGFLMLQWVRQ